jgi:hypothetical protein
MKFETLLLNGLFGACAVVCGWMLMAMLMATPASATVTGGHALAATAAVATDHLPG